LGEENKLLVMVTLDDSESDENPADLETIIRFALVLQVELNEAHRPLQLLL
jgi:hypothetical protein